MKNKPPHSKSCIRSTEQLIEDTENALEKIGKAQSRVLHTRAKELLAQLSLKLGITLNVSMGMGMWSFDSQEKMSVIEDDGYEYKSDVYDLTDYRNGQKNYKPKGLNEKDLVVLKELQDLFDFLLTNKYTKLFNS